MYRHPVPSYIGISAHRNNQRFYARLDSSEHQPVFADIVFSYQEPENCKARKPPPPNLLYFRRKGQYDVVRQQRCILQGELRIIPLLKTMYSMTRSHNICSLVCKQKRQEGLSLLCSLICSQMFGGTRTRHCPF